MIAAVEKLLKSWKRRMKVKRNREKAIRQHREIPGFTAAFLERIRQMNADPVRKAQAIAKMREAWRKKPNAVPVSFTPGMRSKMYRMIRAGAPRQEAIAALLSRNL